MNTETLMNSTKTVSIVGMAKYMTEKNLGDGRLLGDFMGF